MNEQSISTKEYERVCDDLDAANDTISSLRSTIDSLRGEISDLKAQCAMSNRSQDDFRKKQNEISDLSERLSYISELNAWYKNNMMGDDIYSAILTKTSGLTVEQRGKMHEIFKLFNGKARKVSSLIDKLVNINICIAQYEEIPDVDYSAIQKQEIKSNPIAASDIQGNTTRQGFQVGFSN
ncbi:MAG: hypothetical protein K6F33_00270 [Bacteroidales bacterium]|nr:hypothetical protein [Bacteroidales bacterium]